MSANFTPDMVGYKGLSPFRFWCQKTLPLVYDDSLSYYELLCKVVSYINNLITDVAATEENVDRLLTAYNQLQEYVNDYFDGTDFQQKIDDSLDRYAEDGTLSAMVNTHVRALLPYEVGQQIGDVVDEQLPPVVDLKLGAVVDNKLPDVVDDKLEDVVRPMIVPAVSGLLPQEVGRQLPDEVETQLPGAIGEDLETIAPPVIQQWLNDHPDATTSVEDGSISLVKLNTALQRLARLDGNFYPTEYDPTVTYYTDDMCTYRNTLTDVEMAYKCIATSTTGTFSAADWAVVDENDIVINARAIYDLASSIAPVYQYPNNPVIPTGTIFFYRGNARNAPYGLWRATTDIPAATFVTPSYAERVTILDLISGIDQLETDVADLKSALDNLETPIAKFFGTNLNSSDFEQGSINNTGVEIQIANRIRTGFLKTDSTFGKISPNINANNYKFSYAFYSGTTPETYIDDGHDPNNINISNGAFINIPVNAKYVRIIISLLTEGVIVPSDIANYTVQILTPSDISYLESDVDALIYPSKNVIYKKGLPNANGTMNTSVNGAYTSIIRLLNTLFVDGASAVILLYKSGSYFGKINSMGEVDQAGGSWKYFTGLIDIRKILNENDCDSVVLGLIPPTGTVIENDSDADTFARSCIEYSQTTAIEAYVNSKARSYHDLDVPQMYAFNLCAHRGSTTIKDNTIAAYDRAVSNGFRVIETDVNWTSDSICVMYHDNDIDGTPINTLTYAQLHALDPDIPTFTEMLLWAKRTKCLMLLDCVGRLSVTTATTLYNLCAQYGMLDNVIFSVGPDLAYDMADANLTNTNLFVNFYGRNPTASMIENIDPKVNKFKQVGTNYNKDDITAEIITASHLKGYPVEVAIVTTQQMAQTYYNMGIDMLVVDGDNLWDV